MNGRIDQRIRKDAQGGPENQQQNRPDGGSDQEPHIAPGGAQAHGAPQLLGTHDLMDQHLRGGYPNHAGQSVHHQQQHGLPHRRRVAQRT